VSERQGPVLTVIGEALVDLVPGDRPGQYQARPGGSPLNVAVGLARLGHRTALMGRLADNAFGRQLRAYAVAEGLDLAHAPHAGEPTTLAVVGLDGSARASYDFYAAGTADWQWTDAELACVPRDTSVLHVGSLASWTSPGDQRVHAAAAALRREGNVVVSYDPNVRPDLLGEPARARPLIERFASVAHIVKASREDVDWLYPGAGPEQVSGHLLDLGALLVVITDGPRGAHLYRAGHSPVSCPGLQVKVADTIGAGDAFTAGLLGGLSRRGLLAPGDLLRWPSELLAATAGEAVLISALTCERVGADPPFAHGGRSGDPRRPLTRADLDFSDARHLLTGPRAPDAVSGALVE
jgi:fructokinase